MQEASSRVTVRSETSADHLAVYEVNERAFGQVAEDKLVDALRRAADPQLSLVAETEGQVIGHIFFSPGELEPARGAVAAMGLAPMAVLPEHHRHFREKVFDTLKTYRRLMERGLFTGDQAKPWLTRCFSSTKPWKATPRLTR